MLSVEGLFTEYPNERGEIVKAAQDVSFTVAEGQLFTLLGPSGCGKTTTLRSIAGLERPRAGEISVNGQVVFSSARRVFVAPNRRGFGMVFQSYAIWPHMTVFENAAFPLQVRGPEPPFARGSPPDIRDRVMRVLHAVQLGELAEREATKLSGGQQQRLALARALVMEPALLLLDEPLSNLDAKLRERMRFELKRLQRELKITTVYVTHDQSEALALSRQIAVMSEGRILQIGTPRDIYERPASQFVADFVGNTNFIDGVVRVVNPSNGVCIRTEIGELQVQTDQELRVDERRGNLGEAGRRGTDRGAAAGRQRVGGTSGSKGISRRGRGFSSESRPTDVALPPPSNSAHKSRRHDIRAAQSREVRRAQGCLMAGDRWASDIIVDLLHAYDLPYAAINPGASYRGLHDSIVNYGGNRPAMLVCQHEETAVQIAHGYAKASGKPMVAILHNLVGPAARQHGDLLRLHRSRARGHPRRDRSDGRDQAPSAYRLDPHGAEPGRAGARYTKWDYQPHDVDGVPESFRARLLGDDDRTARADLPLLRRVAAGAEARSRSRDAACTVSEDPHPVCSRPECADPSRRSDCVSRTTGDHCRVRRPRARGIPRARGTGRDGWHPGVRRGQPAELSHASPTQHQLHERCLSRRGSRPVSRHARLGAADDAAGERDTAAHIHRAGGCEMDRYRIRRSGILELDARLPASASCRGPHCCGYHRGDPCVDRAAAKRALRTMRTERRVATRSAQTEEKSLRRRSNGPPRRRRLGRDPDRAARLASEVWEAIKNEDWVSAPARSRNGHASCGISTSRTAIRVDRSARQRSSASRSAWRWRTGTKRLVVDMQPDGDLMFDAGALWMVAKHRIPMLVVMYNNRAYYNDWEHQIRMAKVRGTPVERAHIGMDLDDPAPDFAAMAKSMGWYAEGPFESPDELPLP